MHMYIVSFALGDMNYLLKFVACSKLVDDLIAYFEPIDWSHQYNTHEP